MCTMNQQSPIDIGRILPTWSQFKPSESLNRILNKDYGITDSQKKRILDALQSKSQAVKAEDQEEWVDGEWEFFHDKCMELDLDPDFCVEDVYEDDSGSAQFISQLAKSGKYFDPLLLFGTFSLILFGRWVSSFYSKNGCYQRDKSSFASGSSNFMLSGSLFGVWACPFPCFGVRCSGLVACVCPVQLIHSVQHFDVLFRVDFLFRVHLTGHNLFAVVLSYPVWIWSGLGFLGWAVKRFWRVQPNCLAQINFLNAIGCNPVKQAQVKLWDGYFAAQMPLWLACSIQAPFGPNCFIHGPILFGRDRWGLGIHMACGLWPTCRIQYVTMGFLGPGLRFRMWQIGRPISGYTRIWNEGPSFLGFSYSNVFYRLYLGLLVLYMDSVRVMRDNDITPTRLCIIVGFIWFSFVWFLFWWIPKHVLGVQVVGPTGGYAPS
ncbi:hypothetical protein Hanom_Chr15g01337391 [Helianthus anomalus]